MTDERLRRSIMPLSVEQVGLPDAVLSADNRVSWEWVDLKIIEVAEVLDQDTADVHVIFKGSAGTGIRLAGRYSSRQR